MKRLLVRKTKIKVNGAIQTVPTTRALCLALIQKGMAGDVRAISKIIDIAGPEMADELKATAVSLRSADVEIVRRSLARKDAVNSGADSASANNPETETE